MGGADEHLQSSGRGNPDGGAYQQLTLNLFLSEAEQIQSIDEAENVAHTSSAFSFAQNDIDHVLRLGGNTDRQRERVVAAFEKQKTTAEIAEILKTLYHGGNGLRLSFWPVCWIAPVNSACKEAIEQAISAHYAENRLDTEAAVKDVLEKFGAERVQFILANTIQHKNHDGRISQDNKAWAKTIPMPEDSGASRHCAYLVVDQVNPGLTDLFTRQFRKVAQEQQKSSVLQKLKQEPPAHKPAAPKKQDPER